jgi:integrase
MERFFNAWVREFIPDRRSAAYELRRQAGSDMLNATGKISLVQHMLGHTSPQTTARFYAVYDREVDVASVWDKPSN